MSRRLSVGDDLLAAVRRGEGRSHKGGHGGGGEGVVVVVTKSRLDAHRVPGETWLRRQIRAGLSGGYMGWLKWQARPVFHVVNVIVSRRRTVKTKVKAGGRIHGRAMTEPCGCSDAQAGSRYQISRTAAAALVSNSGGPGWLLPNEVMELAEGHAPRPRVHL